MNCKTVQSRLSAYLDRELGGDELLQMRAHMSVCGECHCEAEGLRALKSLLGGIQCPEPPVDLPQRLTATVLRQRYEEPRRTVRFSALMFAGVTACSMLATLLVLNFALGGHANQAIGHDAGSSSAIRSDGPFGGDSGFGGGPILSTANFGPR
jgi:anti-sigma factor RsiW